MTANPGARTDRPKVIVVGARRARQGIGAFVAGWFALQGAEVCAIVGTSDETAARAQVDLRDSFQIHCRAYATLDDCLQNEAADIVAICSPNGFHSDHLAVVAASGCHCLCEKPLHWQRRIGQDRAAGGKPATQELIDEFARQGLLLETITQWPLTLPVFYAIHAAERNATVGRFEMGLSPISTAAAMIPDAGPHFVSMLRELCGDGTIDSPRVDRPSPGSDATAAAGTTGLRISCRYVHESGSTDAVLNLATCARQPRPAWYAINGSRVDRQIEPNTYDQSFVAADRREHLQDPLGQLIARFLDRVQAGGQTNCLALRRDQENVERIYDAAMIETAVPTAGKNSLGRS